MALAAEMVPFVDARKDAVFSIDGKLFLVSRAACAFSAVLQRLLADVDPISPPESLNVITCRHLVIAVNLRRRMAIPSPVLQLVHAYLPFQTAQPVPIGLPIDPRHFETALQYLEYHTTDPPREIVKGLPLAGQLCVFDEGFVAPLAQDTLFALIMVANALEATDLLNLLCASVADLIRGRTPEEIRRTFNIVNDFTPEEEEQVRAENRWAE